MFEHQIFSSIVTLKISSHEISRCLILFVFCLKCSDFLSSPILRHILLAENFFLDIPLLLPQFRCLNSPWRACMSASGFYFNFFFCCPLHLLTSLLWFHLQGLPLPHPRWLNFLLPTVTTKPFDADFYFDILVFELYSPQFYTLMISACCLCSEYHPIILYTHAFLLCHPVVPSSPCDFCSFSLRPWFLASHWWCCNRFLLFGLYLILSLIKGMLQNHCSPHILPLPFHHCAPNRSVPLHISTSLLCDLLPSLWLHPLCYTDFWKSMFLMNYHPAYTPPTGEMSSCFLFYASLMRS